MCQGVANIEFVVERSDVCWHESWPNYQLSYLPLQSWFGPQKDSCRKFHLQGWRIVADHGVTRAEMNISFQGLIS